MAIEVLIHIQNTDPILGEVDELPGPQDTLVKVSNPRMRDGKELHYLADNVVSVFWPISQVSFIEILPSAEDEEVFGFVRE
jgi:hypothetical protein